MQIQESRLFLERKPGFVVKRKGLHCYSGLNAVFLLQWIGSMYIRINRE